MPCSKLSSCIFWNGFSCWRKTCRPTTSAEAIGRVRMGLPVSMDESRPISPQTSASDELVSGGDAPVVERS
jgi:hypothetical protein